MPDRAGGRASSRPPGGAATAVTGAVATAAAEMPGRPARPNVVAMDDRGMVAAMRAADPQGLAAAYDTYAGRLYGYCRSLLRSPDAAADALQDTFVLAHERIDQLRDPERLRPWLYAIARNECLHQLRVQSRTTGIEGAGDVRDETVDLDAHLRTDELRRLVEDAFEGMATRDREVLELAMRQDLQGAELAAALGLSLNHTHALLSRARGQLENSLAAVIVARNGREDCPELDGMLQDWDGTMTVLMRKRVNRHIGQCEICGERKRRDVSVSALLSLLPVPMLPADMRERVVEAVTRPEHAAHRQEVADRAAGFDRSGFPVPRDRWNRRISATQAKTAAVAGVAAAGILITVPLLLVDGGNGAKTGDRPQPIPGTSQSTSGTGTASGGVPLAGTYAEPGSGVVHLRFEEAGGGTYSLTMTSEGSHGRTAQGCEQDFGPPTDPAAARLSGQGSHYEGTAIGVSTVGRRCFYVVVDVVVDVVDRDTVRVCGGDPSQPTACLTYRRIAPDASP